MSSLLPFELVTSAIYVVTIYYDLRSFDSLFRTLRLLIPVESNNVLQFGLNLTCVYIYIYLNKLKIYHWEVNQGTE